MIIESFNTRVDRETELPNITCFYGDDLRIITKFYDKYKVAFPVTAYSFEMRISNKNDNNLLNSVNGSVSSNVTTYNFDTSDLDVYGEYKYILYAENGTECVYAHGNLNIKPLIE